jgi:hypothetical protein
MAKTFTKPGEAQPGPDNLFRPANTGDVRSGDQAPRRTSLYTSAARHPKTVLTVLGVAGAAVALFSLSGSSRRGKSES